MAPTLAHRPRAAVGQPQGSTGLQAPKPLWTEETRAPPHPGEAASTEDEAAAVMAATPDGGAAEASATHTGSTPAAVATKQTETS